jgi:hypothetical protein
MPRHASIGRLAFALAASATGLTGCGLVTGLSDDYRFGEVDGGNSDDAGSSGDAANDGGADGGPACAIPRSRFKTLCGKCLPETCCALSDCLLDTACRAYVECRNACNNESCLQDCERATDSKVQNQFQDAVQACGIGQNCRTACGF